MILQSLSFAVDALVEYSKDLPEVEAVRPGACPRPGCGQLARSGFGAPLGVVGHGTYERQVLGLPSATGALTVKVRRYLCRRCGGTTSVLPDVLHPGRWYGAWVLLEALLQTLCLDRTATDVRRQFSDDEVETPGWRSLRRWRRELGWRLWGWEGRGIGVAGPTLSRACARSRLTRLLARAGEPKAGAGAGARAGPALLYRRVHAHGRTWLFGHVPRAKGGAPTP